MNFMWLLLLVGVAGFLVLVLGILTTLRNYRASRRMAPADDRLIQAMLADKDLDSSVRQALARRAEAVAPRGTAPEREGAPSSKERCSSEIKEKHHPGDEGGGLPGDQAPEGQASQAQQQVPRRARTDEAACPGHEPGPAGPDPAPTGPSPSQSSSLEERTRASQAGSLPSDNGQEPPSPGLDQARVTEVLAALDAAAGLAATARLLAAEFCRPENRDDIARLRAGAEILCRLEGGDDELRTWLCSRLRVVAGKKGLDPEERQCLQDLAHRLEPPA